MCWLFIFKDTEPSPLQDSSSVRQQGGRVRVGCLFLRTPSRAPYWTPPACANRAAYPDPPPVVPHPESIDAAVTGWARVPATEVLFLILPFIRPLPGREEEEEESTGGR